MRDKVAFVVTVCEDRVIANLSEDKNKCAIFTEGLDGHSLSACSFFKEEVEAIIGVNDGSNEYIKKFYRLVEEGNKELKGIRQKGKPVTLTNKRLRMVTYVENCIYAGNPKQVML